MSIPKGKLQGGGPPGYSEDAGIPRDETPELCVPGLEAVTGWDGLGQELAQPWPGAA